MMELTKSGTGWDVTVNITSRLRLNIADEVLPGSAIPEVEIHENIAWWVEWTAVLLILGGLALLIVGGRHIQGQSGSGQPRLEGAYLGPCAGRSGPRPRRCP